MYFCGGEMAEWSNAAVLKTVEGHTSGGSNPSFSAKKNPLSDYWAKGFFNFFLYKCFFGKFKTNSVLCCADDLTILYKFYAD
jgi:hypothetical protein